MCRSVWKGDEKLVARVQKDKGDVGDEGYVNVADQLGISRERGMLNSPKSVDSRLISD
jgi:hypothetical protein